ncbi:uncharacterized protein [Amphiura filiformis]|uniref:uncharacterized protein isoform X1 n=1 Tax=Amphiura filiformis TaxID=82378 RepID=UPI003B218086
MACTILMEAAKQHDKQANIPEQIEKVTDRWTWLKLKKDQNKMAFIKTAGMPAKIHQITNARKPSTEITRAYIKQRTGEINSLRNIISLDQPQIHLQEEIQTYALQASIKLDTDSALAMMRHVRLTWEQLRKLRRYFSSVNTTVASEESMRIRRNQLLGDNIEGKLVPLVFPDTSAKGSNGFAVKETPFVYVKDLPKMVLDLLDRHSQANTLTWHDGMIPDEEIWIKIGGDKGGKMMKMFFQLVNVSNPNSEANTRMFSCFEAKDSVINMDLTLEGFNEQLEALMNMTWQGKKIRLLFFGDLELIDKIYGVLGCNAVYPCPYCETSYADFQLSLQDREAGRLRTQANIKENFERYTTEGNFDKRKSKKISKSIVREPMLCIEPENVVVPSLHVSLGIFKRLYDLLEEECNTLDNTIFNYQVECEEEASQDSQDSQDLVDNNFTQTIRSAKNRLHALKTSIQKKEAKLEDLVEDLPLQLLKLSQVENDKVPTDDDDALQDIIVKQQCLREQIAQMQKELDELKMAFGSGPVSSGLDDVLQKHHVRRQAYHGKTFTGNHVKKACQPEVIEDLAKHALDTVNSMNDHIPLSIFRTASEIKQKYTRILNNFADVHYVINTSNNLSDEEIEKADICIKEFMMSYRLLFPNSRISLKLHILEDHAMQQIRRFRAGLGRLNEQGGNELIKNKIEKRPYIATSRTLCNAFWP